MTRVQRRDDMLNQDKRLDDRVKDLELWRRLGNFGTGGGSADPIPLDVWHNIAAVGEPAFQNSWGNVGGGETPAGYRKYLDGRVRLRGYITGGSAGSIAFTLPAGYRPPSAYPYERFPVMSAGGTAIGQLYIENNGAVHVPTAQADLSSVEFDTGTVTQVPAGPTGPAGPPGPGIGYVHTQSTPSNTWNVVHNLGYFPNVTPIDSLNREFIADVTYVDINSLTVTMTAATAGKAYVS